MESKRAELGDQRHDETKTAWASNPASSQASTRDVGTMRRRNKGGAKHSQEYVQLSSSSTVTNIVKDSASP